MDLAKLSRLQRWILYAAYEGREYGSEPPEVDLYYSEVFEGYFGFPVRKSSQDPEPGSNHFDREEIGRSRYDTAHASLSRAVRRLEARGLATRYTGAGSRWSGLRLTDAGFEAAPVLEHRQMVKYLAALRRLTVLVIPGAAPAWLPVPRSSRTLRWVL